MNVRVKDYVTTQNFTKEELLDKLPELLNSGDSILIKASHFMQFEKIVAALQ